jgi:hypothetical protein
VWKQKLHFFFIFYHCPYFLSDSRSYPEYLLRLLMLARAKSDGQNQFFGSDMGYGPEQCMDEWFNV